MNPCPKCQRPPVSLASPRCSYCGAALREGELDWEAAARKQAADYVEQGRTAPRFKPPLTKRQRAEAVRTVSSGSTAAVTGTLCDLVDGLTHDYSAEKAEAGTHCRCGAPACRLVEVAWEFNQVVGREFNVKNAALLFGLGVISWQTNTLQSAFSTFHIACPACAETTFASKRAFENKVEPLPGPFRRTGTTVYMHVPPPPDASATHHAPGAPGGEHGEDAPADYHLVFSGVEKGPFNLAQLRALLESGRVNPDSEVRIEGRTELVRLGLILDSAG